MNEKVTLIFNNCEKELKNIKDNSIDVIFTSPPYAERRKNCYSSISTKEYVAWFKPIAIEIKRILKNEGSFFINIKSHAEDGERSLYVMDLVLTIKREIGFLFVDEICWTKNAFPGNYKGRLKNGFEPIYHFTKEKPSLITFNPLACGTPIKPESIARSHRKQCGKPKNGSGMAGIRGDNLIKLKLARPSNVINVNNVSNQYKDKQKHPASFPVKLVDFFIKTFSNKDDLILDPFMGSGTVGISCIKNNRRFIGIENNLEYFDLANERIKKFREKR